MATPVALPVPAVTYQGPLNITKGGTYTGAYAGGGGPAITISTAEPVVLDGVTVKAVGHMIVVANGQADLTVKNSRAVGAGIITQVSRMVMAGSGLKRLVFTNNDVTSCGGIKVIGVTNPEISILRNRVRDVIGDFPNRQGFMQFVQFDTVVGGNVEIAWNEIVNRPDVSRVEDNISLYRSGTSALGTWTIHDNLIWGCFAVPARTNPDCSGGGIMLGDQNSKDLGFVEVYGNTVLGSGNYLISRTGGSGHLVRDNIVVSSGRLADGSTVASTAGGGPVGLASWTGPGSANGGSGNRFENNTARMWKPLYNGGSRNDYWLDSASNGNTMTNVNTGAAGEVKYADEQAAYATWAAGVKVPIGNTTTPVDPPPVDPPPVDPPPVDPPVDPPVVPPSDLQAQLDTLASQVTALSDRVDEEQATRRSLLEAIDVATQPYR